MKIVILGASGGIGNAFVQAYANQADTANHEIVATYHHHRPELTHPNVSLYQADITDEPQVQQLAAQLDEVDMLINAVGMLHTADFGPEKSTRDLNSAQFIESMRINSLPTLLLAKHFAKRFRHRRPAIFATVSARVGSIEENYLGGWYSYRASKAALNQSLKTLSIEWRRNLKNVCVAALHPGTTDTSLSKPFQANVPAAQLFAPQQSVEYMIKNVIEQLTPAQSGRFWSFDGTHLPW